MTVLARILMIVKLKANDGSGSSVMEDERERMDPDINLRRRSRYKRMF